MSSVREAIKPYRDDSALVLERPWCGTPAESGNGLLNLGVYGCLLARDRITLADAKDIEATILRCEVTNGRFKTAPSKLPGDACAWDDYVGIAAVARVAGIPEIASRIAEHFPVEHRRFVGIPAFYKVCAGMSLSFFDRVQLAGLIIADAMRSEGSGHVITWLICEAASGSAESVDRAIEFWRKKMSKRFADLGALMSSYYSPNHPFSQVQGNI